MNKLIPLSLLAAGLLAAGIGSASACSYGGTDVAVDGRGNVVELMDNGDGNQVTGRIIGKYNRLRGMIHGDCHVLVVEQAGRHTDVDVRIGGHGQHVAVLASAGADVRVRTRGQGGTIIADLQGGRARITNRGDNDILVQRR